MRRSKKEDGCMFGGGEVKRKGGGRWVVGKKRKEKEKRKRKNVVHRW